jgi:hypothetical protein
LDAQNAGKKGIEIQEGTIRLPRSLLSPKLEYEFHREIKEETDPFGTASNFLL